jgi:hypothetical protein
MLGVLGDGGAESAWNAALFIFYHSGHLSAAASADASQYQHPRLYFPVEITDSCHIFALNAPNIVENFESNVTGD